MAKDVFLQFIKYLMAISAYCSGVLCRKKKLVETIGVYLD